MSEREDLPCVCGHEEHDDPGGECYTSGCKCRSFRHPVGVHAEAVKGDAKLPQNSFMRRARAEADRQFPELLLAPENEQRADDWLNGALWADSQKPVLGVHAELIAEARKIDDHGVVDVTLIHRLADALEAKVTISDEAVDRAAMVLLLDYQAQYDGGRLDEFTDLARAALEAALNPGKEN